MSTGQKDSFSFLFYYSKKGAGSAFRCKYKQALSWKALGYSVLVNDWLCGLKQVPQLLRTSIYESVKWVTNIKSTRSSEDHIRSFVKNRRAYLLCALLCASVVLGAGVWQGTRQAQSLPS